MANRFYTRRFLNIEGHHGGAYILAWVQATGPDHEDWDYALSCLELSDCSRHVSLEFPLGSVEARRNSIRKARLLATSLERFADALEVEARLTAERQGAADAEPPAEDPPRPRRRERRGRPGHTDRLRRAS